MALADEAIGVKIAEMTGGSNRSMRRPGSGWMLFAAVATLGSGGFNTISGIAMLTRESHFDEGSMLYENLAAVGWIILVFGLALLATSALLFTSSPAGRVLGIVLASLSFIFWLTAIGANPIWGAFALLADLMIIFGLVFHPYDSSAR